MLRRRSGVGIVGVAAVAHHASQKGAQQQAAADQQAADQQEALAANQQAPAEPVAPEIDPQRPSSRTSQPSTPRGS